MLNKLAKLREERAEGDKGFTLIELLVVVVIIGVLVAIAIPLYLNYRKGAENKSAQSDVRNAVGTIENCYSDNGNKYPGGTTAVTQSGSSGGVINLSCKSDGSGTATAATSSTGADQTINISDSVSLTYTPNGQTFTVSAAFTGSGHKTFTYSSSTGKTVSS